MNFDQLEALDFGDLETITDWTKLLNDLLGLAQAGGTTAELDLLADKLDEFAASSFSEDLDAITKLDRIARKAARGIRLNNASERIEELKATASEFQAIVKELNAASAALRKEAATLRAEKFSAAVNSLTETIASLKSLAEAVGGEADADVAKALAQAMTSAQKLRALLERPG